MAGTKPLPIQVGTIVRNEAARLPAWLDHWKRHAERVIVLDQHSTDATPDILRESGVEWQQVYPVGLSDTHWDTLLALSFREKPFFRHGVDEFIERDTLEQILAVMRKHPHIAAWWVSRRNWIDGHDLADHREIRDSYLGLDYQMVLSVGGRPYSIPGKAHMWPRFMCPPEMIGFMPTALKIEHRRTLADAIGANASRQHICRDESGNEQVWFERCCREICGAK